jgi:hypothetical protein
MKILVRLAILAVLIWAGIEYGAPWIEKISSGIASTGRPASGSTSGCVAAAEDASSSFGETVVKRATLPLDVDAWDRAYQRDRERVQRARDICHCFEVESEDTSACEEANRALDLLEDFMTEMDKGLRSGNPPLNAPRLQELIDEHLVRARNLARR